MERQVPRHRPQVRQGRRRASPASWPRRVAGSYDLFAPTPESERSPFHSINFVTCHDGFTLNDLVSYNEKHNERNGEDNRDGANDNQSWNCGYEGVRRDADLPDEQKVEIEDLRRQQIKNFLTLLFLSQGTPMLLYGDEMRRTAEGDNNTVFQDNSLNWINWENAKTHAEILRFTKLIIAFRKRHQIVRRWRYLTADETETPILRNITWHGVKPSQADFSDSSRFIAWVLEAFQTDQRARRADLRRLERLLGAADDRAPRVEGRRWYRVVDTSLPVGRTSSPRRRRSSSPSSRT